MPQDQDQTSQGSNEEPKLHPYEGKRGRHPRDCTCTTCSKKKEKPGPPEKPDKPTAPAPTSISDIIGAGETKDNVVPPKGFVQTTDPKGKKGIGVKKKQKKKVTAKLPGKLFSFIGNKLYKITKVEGYKLEKDDADDIAEIFNEMAEQNDWEIGVDTAFGIVFFVWLGIPTFEYLFKNKDKIAKFFGKGERKKEDLKTGEIGDKLKGEK